MSLEIGQHSTAARRRIVLIGAGGFLGRRLRSILEHDTTILPVASRPARGDEILVDLRDSCDLDRLVALASDEVVIYCANLGGRAEADRDPEAARLVNSVAVARLAAASRYFVYFSTDYVFSGAGDFTSTDKPTPEGHYASSKIAGEQAVLQHAERGVVIRTSGLYDTDGTRTVSFPDLTSVDGADDQTSTPTFVPDLAGELQRLVNVRAAGIHHVCGPQTMSRYEFLQLASSFWGFGVRPVTSSTSQPDRRLTSGSASMRAPGEVFSSLRSAARDQDNDQSLSSVAPPGPKVCVLDCVGVVLGGRRWKHSDEFWLAQASLETRTSSELDEGLASTTSNAYTINPQVWHHLHARANRAALVLANNGPWATFETWVRRLSLDRYFDLIINSERDGLRKPTAAFLHGVEVQFHAAPHECYIADDAAHVVNAARGRGWGGTVAIAQHGGPVDLYRVEGLDRLIGGHTYHAGRTL